MSKISWITWLAWTVQGFIGHTLLRMWLERWKRERVERVKAALLGQQPWDVLRYKPPLTSRGETLNESKRNRP